MTADLEAKNVDPNQSDPAELQTREMMLNIGPAHPAMHAIIRIIAKLDGEQIKDADVEIGYLHRAFEKMAENGGNESVPPNGRPGKEGR